MKCDAAQPRGRLSLHPNVAAAGQPSAGFAAQFAGVMPSYPRRAYKKSLIFIGVIAFVLLIILASVMTSPPPSGPPASCAAPPPNTSRPFKGDAKRVVLVSLDGFRHDYLARPEVAAPNLRRLVAEARNAASAAADAPRLQLERRATSRTLREQSSDSSSPFCLRTHRARGRSGCSRCTRAKPSPTTTGPAPACTPASCLRCAPVQGRFTRRKRPTAPRRASWPAASRRGCTQRGTASCPTRSRSATTPSG